MAYYRKLDPNVKAQTTTNISNEGATIAQPATTTATAAEPATATSNIGSQTGQQTSAGTPTQFRSINDYLQGNTGQKAYEQIKSTGQQKITEGKEDIAENLSTMPTLPTAQEFTDVFQQPSSTSFGGNAQTVGLNKGVLTDTEQNKLTSGLSQSYTPTTEDEWTAYNFTAPTIDYGSDQTIADYLDTKKQNYTQGQSTLDKAILQGSGKAAQAYNELTNEATTGLQGYLDEQIAARKAEETAAQNAVNESKSQYQNSIQDYLNSLATQSSNALPTQLISSKENTPKTYDTVLRQYSYTPSDYLKKTYSETGDETQSALNTNQLQNYYTLSQMLQNYSPDTSYNPLAWYSFDTDATKAAIDAQRAKDIEAEKLKWRKTKAAADPIPTTSQGVRYAMA